jgi:CRP/FNR family transcriptional regulator/CRP/FNR family cyclic AMP-dependent transcriptional regulator
MVYSAVAAQLARSAIFEGLPEAALKQLAVTMQPKEYKRRRWIFQQGDAGTALYLIESGRVKVVLETAQGKELLLRVLGAGEVFGELALLDEQPRSASVVAREDTTAYMLERGAFLAFLRAEPEAALHCLRNLAGLVRSLTEQVEDLAVLDVPQRLQRMLLKLAKAHGKLDSRGVEIDLGLTQSELAELIGTSRVSVSQCLRPLRKRGIITVNRQRIVLHRPDELWPVGY